MSSDKGLMMYDEVVNYKLVKDGKLKSFVDMGNIISFCPPVVHTALIRSWNTLIFCR